jgi:2-polyprenyl-3-methyl-5-hydroxy-6-metoxy-1,4-benzoquinol methylase
MSDLLVKIFGWPATLTHGDTMVLDRWRWLKRRLPLVAPGGGKFLDVGCGTGAFTMGAALRGYDAVGLSWDERNQDVANRRAALLKLESVSFPICDVRQLEKWSELKGCFDIALCSENIEHVVADLKLMADIYACLKPGGRLCLSTPNYDYHPVSKGDCGPFAAVEDGGHVRRGYSAAMLEKWIRG